MNSIVPGIALIAIGLLTLLGATFNWWIIMRPSRLFNRILGETVARIIYIIVGLLLILFGIGRLAGINWLGR